MGRNGVPQRDLHVQVSDARIHLSNVEWLLNADRVEDAHREIGIVRDITQRLLERVQKRLERAR